MYEICPNICLITDFLQPELVCDIILKLEEQCTWGEFTINRKKLCRTGCFQGDQLENGATPWLRCPSIEHQTILPLSPIVEQIRDYLTENRGYRTNIAKIQKYNDGNSFIHAHADKILDLDPESPILITRFGAPRTCVLKNKVTKEIKYISMPHNSCLIIEYAGNLEWQHGIIKELEVKDPSYSIVFRNSVTYKYDNYIYGEHTPFKTYQQLMMHLDKTSLLDHDEYTKKIVQCYSQENKNIADLEIYREIIDKSIHPF